MSFVECGGLFSTISATLKKDDRVLQIFLNYQVLFCCNAHSESAFIVLTFGLI